MDSRAIFANLCNILAYLYPDEPTARAIAEDAGLHTQRIEFSTHALNNWRAILNEAVKTNHVDKLLTVVLEQYGKNQQFREIYEIYCNFATGGGQFVTIGKLSQTAQRLQKIPNILHLVEICIAIALLLMVSYTASTLWWEAPVSLPIQTTVVPTNAEDFAYQIRVLNAEDDQPVHNLRIVIELQGKAPLDSVTDSTGLAQIYIPTDYIAKPGRLLINEISGRQLYRQEINLYPDRLPATIHLMLDP